MFQELKTLKVTCDTYGCGTSVIITVRACDSKLPDGWVYKEVGPCGITDYYKTDVFCPKCK